MRIQPVTLFFSITTFSIFCFITIPAHSQCLEDQKSLLLQLKNSLQFDPGSSVKLASWTQINDCCQWNGVTCDHFGHVIGLDLNTESISGGLDDSSSLFGLKFLEKLNLAYNSFNSPQIPSSFGVLTNLRYLNLSDTDFFGQIPMEFSRLTRLVTLDLSKVFYSFTSRTPGMQIEKPNLFPLFRNLSGLTELYLDGVNISANGYEWVQAISSSLPYLRVLSLSDCLLSGPIDSSLLKLQYLSEINLSHNKLLNGSLPNFPQNWSLRNLVLRNTSFSGNLPESIGNLRELRRIDINGCYFSGQIPSSLADLSQLVYLDFSENNFSGSIPSFQRFKNLTSIDLSSNALTGPVPSNYFEGLSNLLYINLGFNSFHGSLPYSLFSLPSVQEIFLYGNNFSGSMPSFQGSKNLTSIYLSNNALTGPLPSIFFEGLSNLVSIDLSSNSFHGSIPSSLFSLPSLDRIDLSWNQFSEVPEFLPIKSSPALRVLILGSNNLQGPIPSYFFDFQGLSYLSLSFNNFSGTIELNSFQRLQNLEVLMLSYNSLLVNTSMSDSSSSSFPQLEGLQLASCKLQKFPSLLMNQMLLSDLDLSNNQISGVIPNWIWNIVDGPLGHLNLSCNLLVGLQPGYHIPTSLTILDLHSNQLSGEIPIPGESSFIVDYSRNNFSSSIPAEIGNCIRRAYSISFSHNKLSGPIPPSICNGSKVEILDLSNNRFTGTIPQCLIDKGTATLGVLNLRNNQLIGEITGTFPEGCTLRTLDLNGNFLEGQVPKSLANCTTTEVLNLGSNKLNGKFPCFLANLSSLRILVLRSNKLQGNIRCRGIRNNIWPKLQIIDLALNNFSGILPPKFFSERKAMMDGGNAQPFLNRRHELAVGGYYEDSVPVVNKGSEMELVKILFIFTAIDFSNNMFEGEMPDTVGDLKSLRVLNLSHNAFAGSIPSSLGNLSNLESLDLSWNKLGGSIPVTLASLTFLSFLNLSYNQLVGMIPSGTQLQSFPGTSYEGNKGLWGPPLTACCKEAEPTTPTSDGRQSNMDDDGINWIYIAATLGYTMGFGVIVVPLLYSKRWRQYYYKPIDRAIVRFLYLQEQRARNQRRRNNINELRRRHHQ